MEKTKENNEKLIEELLEQLKQAHADKDDKAAKKIRRTLRSLGYYISKGGFTEKQEEAKTEEKKEKKTRKEKKTEEKKAEPEDDGEPYDEEKKHQDKAEFIKKTKDFRRVFGNNPDLAKGVYRNLCKEFHPDHNDNDGEIMKKINQLWSEYKKAYGMK